MARLFIQLALLEAAYELDNELDSKRPCIPSFRHIETPDKAEDFMKLYRLSKELVELLEEDLGWYLPKGIRQSGLPNRTKISDADLNIIQVNSSFGASLSDSRIFDQSSIKDHLENIHKAGESVYLLGDSEYPQRPYLMTPIQNTQPDTHEAYNTLHTAAHKTVGQTIQNLKARFRCLLVNRPHHYHPDMLSKIVIACCVLHNICNNARLPAPTLSAEDLKNEWDFTPPTEEPEEQESCTSRNALVNMLSMA